MAQRILYVWVFVLLIISLKTDKTRSDYVNQPKIHLNKGDLILESAYDRNITVRLSHDSALYVNNVNVLEKLRQRYAPPAILDGDTKPSQQFAVDEIKSEIQNLQEDLERLATRLIIAQNRTRRTLQLGVIRRNLRRINRLNGRLLVLERKLKKDECQETTEPCKNGGTCYDSYNGFHCECSSGYTGKTCEVDVDECYLLAGTDLGCQNNAACINTPGSYKCICAKGFSGTHCRLRNAICHQHLSGELCAHGSCVPANNAQGYTCICDQGWQRNTTTSANGTNLPSLACDIDVNECEESRNPCFNECINLPGGFKCGPCPPGYTGNGVTCLDVDECAINNGGCSVLPKVRCINTEGSYRCGNCPPGWMGDGHTCELAPSNSCNDQKICHPQAKCEYISEIPSCTCPPGMFGHGFGPQGCHTNPITDSCENHLCLNNGTCLAQGRTTSCLCPAGFSGALCEITSSCHPNPCENGGTCKPSGSDSYKCVCAMGTTGKRCEILRSICSRTLRRPAGELKYPTDDSPEYAFNEKCAWIIRTNATEILNVTFTKFDLEESTDCSNDFLQIHDGNSLVSQLIGRFCGQNLPLGGTILSSHNVLFFWFKSNNATNRPGFEMSWSSQPYICGENLVLSASEVGVIKSPGYPGKSPANRECQWQLTAPYGSRLVLRIYDVSLGSLPNCSGDVLKIYDADLMLKQYCETSLADVLHSSSNQVLLHFHTDRFSSDSAFQLHYAVEPGIPHCGGMYTEPKGFVMGPSQQATCLYLIQQPSGTQVKWEFLDFQTYENINCELNRIEIFDGKTDEDERLLVSCGDRKPEPVISSSNYMLVRFTNSLRIDSSQITPFKAKYSRACEFRVFGPDVGVLTTPNYPKPYIEHITCTFYIYGPGNTFVSANFTDVSLAETNPNEIADSTDSMENINNTTTSSNLNDDSITYMDVYLSKTNKRRYYKAAPMHLLAQSNEMIVVFHATTNSVKARGLRLEYSFESKGCGGIFSGNNGTIFESLTARFCTLTFTSDEGNHLKVDLNFMKRVPILIYANTTNNGDLLLRNISSDYRVQDTFNFNTVTMTILSPALIIGTYEFISTAYACGGNFSTLYGAVTSPSWPRAYQANLDCVWIITAPLGNRIELKVHNFTLEPTCSGDILEIRNGKYPDSPLIGRYCQDRIPSRIASFTNSLYLRFTSDNYVEGPGFYLIWQQTSTGCGGKLTSYSGSIHTPHYDDEPEVRGMNNLKLTCDWLIVVSQGSVIDLSLTTAEDEFEFCLKNNLLIYDGASTLNPILDFNCFAILKGQHLLLKSTTNQLLIIYTLTEDSKYTSPEFRIDYETNCNTVIYDYRGVIESPNFPEDYPKNLNCNWHLKTGRNNKFQLVFSHLNVEVEDMDCEYDYVEIVDMKGLDVLKKRRLCFKPQEPIISEGNQLVVHFVTDYSNPKEGFHMEFTSVGCGEHLSQEFGSITSPNSPYSSDMDCDWYIEVAAGRQITLKVIEFHLENENPDCGQNVLLFKDSRNSSYELAKECQQQQVALTVTSPANRLFIHFHTSAVRSRKFFKAFYHAKRATCGGTFRGNSGFITLANQPFVQGGNVDCIWEINMPEFYGIVLDFQQFELRNSPNCSENSLEFFTNNYLARKSLGKFCGSEKPNLKTIHNSRIVIEYRERGHNEMANLTLRYKKQCGGLVTQADGYIKSFATEDCRWEFAFQADTLISLHIIQLDCYCPKNQTTALNCGHYLGIRRNYFDADIEANDNKTLYFCERHQTDMMIEATRLDIYTRNINFKAKFSTIQNTCGGHIESAHGTIVSPHFPSSYPSDMDCTWTIQGSKGSFLQLQFVSLDIAKSEHCNEDYLEIRTWSEGKILGLYCGSELPSSELTSYERLWLRFHSSPGNIGKGFEITWSYVHLNELVNVSRGYIANPPVRMVQDDEEPYAWRIMVKRGEFIELLFKEYNQGLKLYDGYDDTALSVEIQASPWRFVSSTNVVFLQTENENFETFSIVWNVTTFKPLSANATLSECHSEEFVKVHRFNGLRVMSPGYPKGYGHNLNCDWIFKPFYSVEHVAVKLYNVDLETTGRCSADYLRISTSVDLITWHKQQQLCNGSSVQKWAMESPFMFVDGTPHLKLEFKTDASENRTGFLAKVVAKCGSNLTDSVGFIDGKMLWDFYDGPNTECVWHVNLKPGKRIKIKLDYPATPLVKEDIDESCSLHALLYDGIDDHAPLLKPGKLCYPQNVTVIQSNTTSNHLTIKYKLNFDKVSPKVPRMSYWNLTYREFSECSQDIRLIDEASEVNITSPQYPNVPHPHTECQWRIMAPQGELLQIEFLERFDMNSRYCTKEYIKLFDGSTSLARSLGRYCTKPPTLRTTQNMLYIQYLTDIAEPRNGFKARISISKCGGLFDESYGVITSPGYPGSYPAYSQCDFVISFSRYKFIQLSFIDMNLPFDEAKLNASDYLEIITIDGPANGTPVMLFYGNTTNTTSLQIASNKAVLRFHTYQKTFKHRGFSVRYNSLGTYCSHSTVGVSGIINMNLPTKSHFQNVCSWKITVPKGQKARVEFLNMEDFQLENITDNLRFTLYNCVDMTSEIISFNPITFDRNSVIESTDNLIHIRVVVPKTELRLRSLKLRYSSDNESPCPHDIEMDDISGSVDIPGGRAELMGNFYCGVKIKLNEGETIAFNISTLIVSGYNLPLAPLVFRDGYVNIFYRSNLTGFIHTQSKTLGSVIITQNKQGRIYDLKMSYKKYPCGGTITANNGQQIKPPSPDSVNLFKGHEIVCRWHLFKPYSSSQTNNFKLIGNVSFTDSCDKEFIKITIEGVSGSKTDFTICKDIGNQTFEYELSRGKAYVVYRAENYQPEKNSFVLSLQQTYSCSMDISMNRNPVTLRINKAQYKNNQECSWILTARAGEYVQIQFIGRFFIENSANCTKDYLEIQRDDDGVWLPEARFCGREAPDVYNTSSRRIQIVFRTDDSATADGFELLVYSHCKLRVNVTSNEPTLVVSPVGAGNMWRERNCEYEFYGLDPNKLIVVRTMFADNNIYYARSDTCRFGSMTVYKSQVPGEGNEPVRHCELEFEERAYKYLRLVYNAIRGQKFTLEYAYDSCGGNVTTPTTLRPLKHATDDTYADNMVCIWYVTAPKEHSIAIRFKYFITEENYDILSIYSGPSMKKEKLMAKLSGNYTAKTPIMVDSNQAVLKAISDNSNSRKGFEAQIVFVANCNERIALTDGNSPVTLTRNFQFNSSEEYLCNYRITAPQGYRIRVDIRKLQINNPNSTCQNLETECSPSICNYLAIFDGSIATQEISSKKFCAIASVNRTFVSSTEYATLNLNAVQPGQYNFEIILTMERTECGLTEYKMGENEKYKFTFPPNVVGPYKPHVHCTWSLITEKRLDIHFNYIDLQNKSQVSGKCLDYIRVSHIYSTKDLCGHSQNFTLYSPFSSDKRVEITFHSDEAIEGKGFEFVAQRSDTCNRTYEFLSSRIDYQGYNSENETCVDTIKVPENYTLSFFVNTLYFKNFDCDKLHLKIIDVKTNETLLNRCRNSYLAANLFTQTNTVQIEAAQFSIVSIVYIASERGIIPGCGGVLTLTEAQFSSPPYENDRNFSECRWDIKIPTVSRVEMRFQEFNMGSITNCNLDNVKIIEILPNGMERLYKTLCGPEVNSELQISGTHFAIVSKKSPNFDGTGWTLNYYTLDIANNNDAI